MNINWKVRFKNPTFWVQIAVAVVVPILAYFGMSWDDMTTWSALGNIFIEAVKNPVVIVSVIVSVWNAVNDPTTTGLSDSTQAMSYDKPSNK
jgi:phi LC3 family holin